MARKPDQERRERIIEVATAHFGERGFTETTVKEIADEAEVSPGSLYTYFQNKEELFRAAVETGWAQFIRGMERLRDDALPFEKKILWLVDSGFDALRRVHPLLRGMYSDATRRSMIRNHLDSIIDTLGGILLSGNEKGLFRNFENVEMRQFILRSMVQGVFFEISTTGTDDLDNEIERLHRLIKSGVEHTLL